MLNVEFKNRTSKPIAVINFLETSYAVNGEEWIEVPKGTKTNQIKASVKDVPDEVIKAKPKKVKVTEEKHDVKSSKGDKTYTVTVDKKDGEVSGVHCTCPGFGFRRKCKHIEPYRY